MILKHIVAMDNNRAIGKYSTLPWRIPADLDWFKQATTGKHCIVGRKTYYSLPQVVKDDPNRHFHKVSHVDGPSLSEVLELVNAYVPANETVWIIGGSEIYSATLDIAKELWITLVNTEIVDPDTYYPEFTDYFVQRDSCEPEVSNNYHIQFTEWVRK